MHVFFFFPDKGSNAGTLYASCSVQYITILQYFSFYQVMKYLLSIFNGLLVGILVAFTILYVFQIKNPYPLWILKTFEKSLVLLLLLFLGIIFLGFNKEAGVLIIILTLALFIDKFLFARQLPISSHIRPNIKEAPISNKIYKKEEEHGVTLLPLSNTPPGSFPPEAGVYLPLAEICANEKGLKDYKDKLLIKSNEFHNNLKPQFGSNYIITQDEYANVP